MTRSMTVGRRALCLAVGAAATALAVTGCSAGQIAETAMKAPSVATVSADSADGKLAVRGLAVAYEGVEGYPAGSDAPLHVTLINQTPNLLTVAVGIAAPAEGAGPTDTTARGVRIVAGGAEPASTATASASAAASPSGSASPETSESPTGQQADPKTSSSASSDEDGQEQAAQPNASVPAVPSAGSGSPSPSRSASASSAGREATVEIPANGSVVFSTETAERLSLIGLVAPLRSGMSVTLTFQATEGGAASPPLTMRTPVDIPLTPAPREAGEEAEHHE